MISPREYLIERMKGKKKTIDEFNYDTLDAPPLAFFFNPFEIAELNRIASSLKLQSKPRERYDLIDRIMKSKGLFKFGSGTNRVIYCHPEFPDIVFKIAADNVGLGDNPAEYRNQFLVRPFVAKTFEISPCGTVAISEKVNPIQSREEFISVADDVFEVITEFFIGKYILADIGEKFFMNWGVRKGFGPVLLDYPYIYELDGDKLYCCRPEPSNQSGTCDGLIDYDAGFDMLRCEKCGAIYKAAELKKNIEHKIIKSIGGKGNMKIVTKGSKGTKTFGANNTPFKPQEETVTAYRSLNVKPNKKRNEVVDSVKVTEEKFEKFPEKTVNGVVEKDTIDPIKFDEEFGEECRKKAEEEKKNPKKPAVERIDDLVKEIIEISNEVTIDMVKDDALLRAINHLFDNVTDEEKIVKANFVDEIFEVLPVSFEIKDVDKIGNDVKVDYSIGIGDFKINNQSFTIDGILEADEDEEKAKESTPEFYDAYVKSLQDVYPEEEDKKVLVLSNGNEGLAVDKADKPIIITRIDDRSINSLDIVSSKWLDNMKERLEEYKKADGDEEAAAEEAVDDTDTTEAEGAEEVVEEVEKVEV